MMKKKGSRYKMEGMVYVDQLVQPNVHSMELSRNYSLLYSFKENDITTMIERLSLLSDFIAEYNLIRAEYNYVRSIRERISYQDINFFP